jgi:hypothetical protein
MHAVLILDMLPATVLPLGENELRKFAVTRSSAKQLVIFRMDDVENIPIFLREGRLTQKNAFLMVI